MTTLLHVSSSPAARPPNRSPWLRRSWPLTARCIPRSGWKPSTCGTARCPGSARWAPAPSWPSSAAPARTAWTRSWPPCGRRRGPWPTSSPQPTRTCSACTCGTPTCLTCSSSGSTSSPARHAVRLRPGRRLHRAGDRQEGRRDLHQRRLRPGVLIAYGTDFHSSFLSDWLRFAGVTDVAEIRFQPTILTAGPAEDRAAAHTAARTAAKIF